MHIQIEEEDLPSNLSGETSEETNIVREEVFVETSKVRREGSSVNIDLPGGGGISPPIPPILPIDLLVRPMGLPIVVPRGLVAVDLPSTYQNFMEQRMRILRGIWRDLLRE